FDLVAHGCDGLCGRADEDDAGPLQGDGQILVLRQKSIARMHRLSTRLAAGGNDLVDVEIALGRRRGADQHRVVGFTIDRDRLDAEKPRRADHAAGNFTPIGDEDFSEQGLDHSGMLSCFFQGFSSRLVRSMASARHSRLRVECGMMTSSMKPRDPATKGLANLPRYSSARSSVLAAFLASPRKMISTAPLGPITAISALGQA